VSLADLATSIDLPVFLVDEDTVIRNASRTGLRVVGKDRRRVEDHLGGDVFECVNAQEPEGCGRTIHCSGCTVRRTVTHTFETGEAQDRVPATLKVGDPDHPSSIYFFVSTRKLNDGVLLRIEMAGSPPQKG
jgi:hypothetical protein